MSASRRIADAAQAVARSRAVRGAATAAAMKLASRADRLLAIRLARQIQGRYSEHTIIAGTPHSVVWKDGVPVEAFPPVEDLELRPELRDFDERLQKAPPAERGAGRLMKR